MLNQHGGIEADLTVTRLAEDRFRLVTGTAFGPHDQAWLRRNGVATMDVTSAYVCYCLWGPHARAVLSELADEPPMRFMTAREITVGHVPVLAQRVTFVGEFGWELYAPAEYGLTLWDSLMAAGLPYGVRPAGYRAIDAMRLEKGYRVWGLDISPETTPFEAGLGFAVHLEKDFLGRAALNREPRIRLRGLILDQGVCLGTEPVRIGERAVGRVTSGGYGYRVGASIAYAYLPAEVPEGQRVEVGLFAEWIGAIVRDP